MERLGFNHRWIDWTMACVTTVSYQVKFNGTLLESFSPSRGLRQGDPLSPFLFLFVADGLSHLLQREVGMNRIEPIRICRRAPGVSHLLFADDSLLFFKADVAQALRVKEVLDLYATSTGQLINPGKCSILFGEACPIINRAEVKEVLQVTQENFESKYLGLPTPEGRMSKGKFESLQAKLANYLVEWDDNQQMSQAAKEVLIKSIAQALPVYVMGVFKLPVGLCDELTKIIRQFWWGGGGGQRKENVKPTGSRGTSCLDQRIMVALGLETCDFLIRHCLPDKLGG
jgi:hypothetical protein